MDTEVIRVDPGNGGAALFEDSSGSLGPVASAIERAVQVLEQGGLVALPTETVYGLAVRADRPEAVARLRSIKERDRSKALTVHIGSPDQAAAFVPDLAGLAARLIRKAWPGPLTLILSVDDPSAAPVMAGLNGSVATTLYHNGTIGLRCPDQQVTERILKSADGPVVASSANRAGLPPPWMGEDVLRSLDGQIDLLIDANRTKFAKPSTIVRVAGSSYNVVREGVLDSGIIERLSKLGVLFVCTGNTCRSPMAAGMARKLLADRLRCGIEGLAGRGVEVCSAGTSGGGGGASPAAVAVMARRGVDLSAHRSEALTADTIRQADYIFVMTQSHLDRVLDLEPAAEGRVSLLLSDRDVRDPMGGSEEEYEACAKAIEEGLAIRLQEVVV